MPAKLSNSLETAVLNAYGLELMDIEEISSEMMGEDCVVNILLTDLRPPCPRCGTQCPIIHAYTRKTINHNVFSGRKTKIIIQSRRYRCRRCWRTYTEENPLVFRKQKVSKQVVLNILNDLKNPTETFTSVGKRYGVSPTTAANIFDMHICYPEPVKLGRILLFDETYSFKSEEYDSKYVCMILDYETQTPIDLLPSRRKDYLEKYLKKFPKEEREKVEYVAADMYDPYRRMAKKFFPNAKFAADRFHVLQDCTRKMHSVRVRVMKGSRGESDRYYLLKHHNDLLMVPPTRKVWVKQQNGKTKLMDYFDPNLPRKYNIHFKKWMNNKELLDMLLDISPDLRKAWELKNELHDFYEKNEYETAKSALIELIQKFTSSGVWELVQYGDTLERWFDEIVNSFIVIGERYEARRDGSMRVKKVRLTSGLIENRNRVIKAIKDSGNGYTNWYRFRNRCLYALKKENPLGQEVPKTVRETIKYAGTDDSEERNGKDAKKTASSEAEQMTRTCQEDRKKKKRKTPADQKQRKQDGSI